MARSARYYLSRLVKSEFLTSTKLVEALKESVSVTSREFAWMVVDVSEGTIGHAKKRYPYLSGKLVKYDPDAFLEVVDESVRKVRLQSEPNMQRASSLFVYLPTEAVFSHQHVWNEIRPNDFRAQMAELITMYHQKFMVDCQLQPIADLNRFITKLGELEQVSELKAQVSPPNPLFGHLWESLNKYIADRNLDSMTVRESVTGEESIKTNLPQLARSSEERKGQLDAKPAELGDAAVLMAADGYGSAQITGKRGNQTIVVRTVENAIQLKLKADITPQELAKATIEEVVRLNESRQLRHQKDE